MIAGLDAHEIAVIGGTGFIGRHFLAAMRRDGRELRVLTRGTGANAGAGGSFDSGVTYVSGDMADPAALTRLITPGCSVVNFAWNGFAAPRDAVDQARGLAAACRAVQARALLHCSTAAVYGGCDPASRIDDSTPPRPADTYGRTKLAVDDALQEELVGRVPLIILRPTSVFGRGGLGLIKMARSVAAGAGVASYLRSCLFDRRLLHLVPVETLVEAFRFFEARACQGLQSLRSAHCRLVSADDEPLNRFRALEQRLMTLWQRPDYRWPRVPVPSAWLRLALRASGRSHSLPFTPFDGRGLREEGFTSSIDFESAVADFAAWFLAHERGAP